MSDKPRLLLVSDEPGLFSGLARCTREIAQRFQQHYDVAVAGWHAQPIRHSFPYHIYPIVKGDSQEGSALVAILKDFRPAKVLCIGDIWDFGYFGNTIAEYRADTGEELSTHLWTTPDGEWTEMRWEETLRSFDAVSSFSQFGATEIQRIAKIPCPVIYPGVDTSVFYRPEQLGIDEGSIIDPSKTFVILTVAQNTSRKNLPAALEAYAEFLKVRPNAHYILVTDPEDAPQVGYNLMKVCRWLGLLNHRDAHGRPKISFVNTNPRNGISDEKVAWSYLLSHCFLLPSIGEGAALPLFEAMATKSVPIATNYSAITEVIGDRGLLADVGEYLFGAFGVRRAIVSRQSIVDHLVSLYDDWEKGGVALKDFGDRGAAWVKTHTWDRTATALQAWLETPPVAPGFVLMKTPIRTEVCLVVPTWGKPCGIAEYSKQLIVALEKAGTKVSIFPDKDIFQIKRMMAKHPMGVVNIQHEFSFFPDKYLFEKGLQELREAGLKTVVTLHSATKLHAYNQMLFRSADRVIVHAPQLRDMITAGRPATNVSVVPMGCGAPLELNGFAERRQTLQIANHFPIVGSFGFLRDQKGYADIAQAVALLRKTKYPKILFLLVSPQHVFGSAAYDQQFYAFIKHHGLEDCTMIYREFLPEEQLISTLQCADVFVLNYQENPAGGGISAAIKAVMRTQRPIIASKTMAFADLGPEVAWLEQQTPMSIAMAIDTVLTNTAMATQLVENSNEYLTAHAWSDTARQYQEVFNG